MSDVAHLKGHTVHSRHGSVDNRFRYGIDYVLLDPDSASGPALFSRDRFNLFSLRSRDHGGSPKEGRGAAWAREVLREARAGGDGALMLLAQPRVLGHVFNPVSFWLSFDVDGGLRAVIAEVSNTFGDRHSYLCRNADGSVIQQQDRITAEKVFHVSPFQPIAGSYQFRFDITPKRIGIWIDFRHEGGGVTATLTGTCQPLTNLSILGAMVRRPLGARRVLGLIHWQALKLWWKGARYRRRPLPPQDEVS